MDSGSSGVHKTIFQHFQDQNTKAIHFESANVLTLQTN